MVRALSLVVMLGIAGCASDSTMLPAPTKPLFHPKGGWDPWNGAFSPDGENVAFFGFDPANRPRIALLREGRAVPVTDPDLLPSDFAWMPDSSSLLVAFGPATKRTQLAVVDLAGKILRLVPIELSFGVNQSGMTVNRKGTVALVSASAAGPLDTPADLIQLDLQTGMATYLTRTPDVHETWPQYLGGDEVLFTAAVLSTSVEVSGGWAGILDTRTGNTKRITGDGFSVETATAAPSGSLIVFDSYPFRGLWSLKLTSNAPPEKVANGRVRWPSFRPDGNAVLAKEIGSPTESGDLLLIDVSEQDA